MYINELFENQLKHWDLAKSNYDALQNVESRKLLFDGFEIVIQYNPGRIQSTVACVNKKKSFDSSSCFLCEENRPKEQVGLEFEEDFLVLCNPYPVFSKHLTIANKKHIPQSIVDHFGSMLRLAKLLPGFLVFYNGPRCGASAPMHLHFQAGPQNEFPIYRDFGFLKSNYSKSITESVSLIEDGLRTFYVLEDSDFQRIEATFNELFLKNGEEPNLNILLWFEHHIWTVCVFERKQHRPSEFFEEGDKQRLISPASVEMAGLIITPREIDFNNLTKKEIQSIYSQVIKSKS